MLNVRIGQGFDIHPLVEGRTLIIGGTQIPYDKGLDGHSDADVLLHAISDSLLGAAGLPDIGHYFPPTDPQFKDADSSALLAQVKTLLVQAGFPVIGNIDCVVLAERPKLAPYIGMMKQRIATVLTISVSQIGIKATTCERLGLVGREEGIAAMAVSLISSHE